MRLTFLSSGSRGNSTLVEAAGVRLLLDAGISCKTARARCAEAGAPFDRLDALLVTHEHTDHCTHAAAFSGRFEAPVVATRRTLGAVGDRTPLALRRIAEAGAWIRICRAGSAEASDPAARSLSEGAPAELWALPLALPHDAAGPVAWRLEERTPEGVAAAAVVTDLGAVEAGLLECLRGLDLLALEFNHDPTMLREGPYPAWLQQRIRGGRGHLSNEQAAAALEELAHPLLGQLVLAHLSEHNNTEALARAAAQSALDRRGSRALVATASVHFALPTFEVAPRAALKPLPWPPARPRTDSEEARRPRPPAQGDLFAARTR
jgi:phosphoribosyl 1,2-cyclic phosphodiesterase